MIEVVQFINTQLTNIYLFYNLTTWLQVILIVPIFYMVITLIKSLYTGGSGK